MSTVEDYLSLPYHVTLTQDGDEDGRSGWVADILELPGCISQGDTPDEAVENIMDAMAGWIRVALEDGREIPTPQAESHYSGRFVLRLPASLHAQLARNAEAEGISLNQFVSSALAGAVGWRTREPVG